MQLKSLAKSTEALNKISTIIKNTTLNLEEREIALTAIGKAYTREILKVAIAQSALDKAQIETILSANGLQGELLETTADELANAASTNAVAASQAGATTSTLGLGTAFKGLGIAIKDSIKAMWAWLTTTPAGWATAAVAAISVATYGIIKFHNAEAASLEKQKDKLNETKEAYEDLKNELQELETEIQNNISAIRELESTQNLTWVEQEELERLRKVTKELELQKQLKQDEHLQAAEDLYRENKKTFNKEFESSYGNASVDDLKQQLSSGHIGVGQLDLTDNVTDIIASIQYLNEEKKNLTDESEIAEYNDFIEELTESLKNKGSDYLSSLSQYKQNILEIASVRKLTKDEQATYDDLTSMQKMIYEFYSPATWNTIEFDSIFDTEGLEKTKEELTELAEAGELSPEVLQGYPKLNNAIKQSAIIAGEGSDAFKEFYNQVMALANPNAVDYDEVRRQLFESSGIGYGRISGAGDAKTAQKLERAGVLSNEGLEAYIAVRAKYDLSEFSVDDLIFYIQQELNDEPADIEMPAFNDIFSLKDTDGTLNTLGQLNDQLNSIQTAYKNLTDAMDSYSSAGSITIDQFQAIVEQGADFLDYLTLEDGQLGMNEQAMYDLAEARIIEMKAQMVQGIVDNVSQIKKEGDEAGYLASTNYELAASYEVLAESQLQAWKAEALANGLSQDTVDKVMHKAEGDIQKINALVANIDPGSIGGEASSAASSARSFTDLLDKELNVLDKKMEAGYMDFNDYIQARLSLIEDYYSQGKIQSDEYYSYLENHYKQELSYRDKVIHAVTRRIDREIKSLEKEKDAIEENYQLQIDALENQKTLLEDANRERQRQIDLQKAQYDLERAKNQRTSLVYSEGGGMRYVADDAAIRDAENAAENARQEIQIAGIEKSISALEQARDTETAAIDGMIDKLQEYKEAWNDITSAYEEEQEDLIAAQILGQEWENDIIDCRLDVLNQFKDEYAAIQQSIVDMAWQSANEQIRAAQEAAKGAAGSMGSAGKIGNTTEYEVVYEGTAAPVLDGFYSKSKAEEKAKEMSEGIPDDEPSYYVTKKKYHTGLKQGTVNAHSFDDDFKLVQKVGLGEKEVPAILKEGEAVATPAQISNIADGLRTADNIHSVQAERLCFMDRQKQLEECAALLGRSVEEMLFPTGLLSYNAPFHDMEKMTGMGSLHNVNSVNNIRQNQPITMSNNIYITCPGITSQEVARQVGTELNNLFNGFHLDALQQSMMR